MPSIGSASPTIGVRGFAEVALDADVHRRVVHVVLDALAVDDRSRSTCFAELDVRAEVDAPADGVAAEVDSVVVEVVPLHLAQDAGDLDVAPVARLAEVRREVGQREARRDVLQLDAVGEVALVGARARPLERDREARVASVCHGVQRSCTLRKNTMPFGPQYSTEFGNTSGSMNGLQVWPAPNLPELAPGVAQAERRLPGVDAGAEQLELEDRLELARARWA